MAFVSKLKAVASKIESTAGTAETLTNADNNLRIMDLAVASIDVPFDQSPSKYATGDFGIDYSIPGNQSCKIGGNIKLWSQGTSAEPAWTKIIKTAGCQVTSGVSGYTVTPAVSAIGNSMTWGVYEIEAVGSPQALKYEVVGAVNTASIKADGTGKPYVLTFEATGALNDITDVNLTAVPVFSAISNVIPDKFINGVLTIGTFSACVSTLEFNLNNEIQPVECIGADSGFERFLIVNQAPTLVINPLLTRVSEYDFFGKLTTGTIEQIVVETAQFKLTIPRAQIGACSLGDRNGIVETQLTFNCLRPSTAGSFNYAPFEFLLK